MCFFVKLISHLDNKEGINLITNFPQKQAKQIEQDHNFSTSKTKETKSQKIGKRKAKTMFLCFAFKETKETFEVTKSTTKFER